MTTLFRYETDPAGKPSAISISGAQAGLAAFLTEEASWSDYIDLLLGLAEEAVRAGMPRVNTGNAYAVTIGGSTAIIEHLHQSGRPSETVPLPVFMQALREWRTFLDPPRRVPA
ncbi:MAG: hypothetical protein EXR07_20595 [Acetobacteraceae bacterium]|nr:hypothetical protein [Acetobacteraceae bacterium]